MTVPGLEWLPVLRAYSYLGVNISRHPEDVCRGNPDALQLAYDLDKDGYLFRNPATGYFCLTQSGAALAKSLEALP